MAKGRYNNNQVPDPVYPKEKAEDYNLMGGINTKVSLYTNGPTEFRDLSNLNFMNTGALTKRPGTTLFGGQTLISPNPAILTGYEFSKLSGNSFLMVVGNTNIFQTNSMSFLPIQYFNGHTPISYSFGTTSSVPIGFYPGSLPNFITFVDRLFGCDGTRFFRINPNGASGNSLNAYLYSLPPTNSYVTATGYSSAGTNLSSGTYLIACSFINDRGLIGPINFPTVGISISPTFTYQWTMGASVGQYLMDSYGITAIQFYRSQQAGSVLSALTAMPVTYGMTFSWADDGASISPIAATPPNSFMLVNDSVVPQFPFYGRANIPRYLEIFNNQLFMAGFSTAPSTFWWSEIGDPESVDPNFSDEVRTNDGDVISGMRACLGSLLITKRRSLHILSGDNPDNFLLQEISDQYGCVSHRAVVVWNNVVWFLDSKGVMEYNGANLRCVSTAIEPIFNAMNLNAAYDNACGIHVKKYNEIWFAIPANGSTINNQIIVYDYVANAWTHYDGVQAQCLFNARSGFSNQMPFAGNYTGGLVYFDSTLTSDNNNGITCSFDSIFFAARGQTTENMYRRFYLNVDPVMGFTQPINMTFKTNFGSSVQLSRTMYQAPYQSRIDFGLSARSIQASMYHYSASLSLKINGFTVESRFQRGV